MASMDPLMDDRKREPDSLHPRSAGRERDTAIDYLRGAVTVLVVAHHAALAYATFSRYDPAHYAWSTAPVVDARRWPPLDYFIAWNDIYFMGLLFFVSGLFVPASLMRKGAGHFLIDRIRRLGIPFAIAVAVLMPIAYFPSWWLSDGAHKGGFIAGFFTTDGWPVGPPWFLWMLLALCAVAALGARLIPRAWFRFDPIPRSPSRLAWLFLAVSIVTVAPMRLFFAPDAWSTLGGPLDFQTSRVLLYAGYFLLGMALGGDRIPRSLSAANLRPWPLWSAMAMLGFVAHWFLSGGLLLDALPTPVAAVIFGTVFATCCAFTSLAALGLVRFLVRHPWKAADSLSANAYGIYIIHYVFVVWLQFALLSASLHSALKFAVTFATALAASWLATALLRRTVVRRFL
jgi:glucans biosynthesis protein C